MKNNNVASSTNQLLQSKCGGLYGVIWLIEETNDKLCELLLQVIKLLGLLSESNLRKLKKKITKKSCVFFVNSQLANDMYDKN